MSDDESRSPMPIDGLTAQDDGQDTSTGTDNAALEVTIETAESWVAPNTTIYTDTFCQGTGIIGDPADPSSYVCPHCNGTGKKQ